jgi:hypothetical protein
MLKMSTWLFKNGSKIEVVPSEQSIRGKGVFFVGSTIKPTMWCPECQLWTKEYKENGNHVCGSEVTTGSLESGFPGIDYEGESTLKN